MALRVKIWLTGKGAHGFLGEGRYHLLRAIARQGSLRQAAKELGVSYRKAWGDIRSMQEQLGFELVSRQRGGSRGGTSCLTERAKKLLEAFAEIKTELERTAKLQYEQKMKPLMNDETRRLNF